MPSCCVQELCCDVCSEPWTNLAKKWIGFFPPWKCYDGRQKTDSKCYFSITHSSLLQMDGIYVLQVSSSQSHFVLAGLAFLVCLCFRLSCHWRCLHRYARPIRHLSSYLLSAHHASECGVHQIILVDNGHLGGQVVQGGLPWERNSHHGRPR